MLTARFDRNRPVKIRLSCADCEYEEVVSVDADPSPADRYIEHGRRTGHTVVLDRIRGDQDDD